MLNKLWMTGAVGATLIAATLMGSSAMAEKYGLAGCGLGSMLFGDKPGIIQVLAATTNGTFGNQTFGITSGTSNCTTDAAPAAAVPAFVEANRIALADDIARGNGETLQNLSGVMGCTDSATLGTTLQKNYSSIFPTTDATTQVVSTGIVNVVKSDATLAQTCKNY